MSAQYNQIQGGYDRLGFERFFTKEFIHYYFFTAEGRMSLSEVWICTVMYFMLNFIAWLLFKVIFLYNNPVWQFLNQVNSQGNIFSVLFDSFLRLELVFKYMFISLWLLSFILMAMPIYIKRLHDRNLTGWYLLLSMVPLANIWIALELFAISGKSGDNEFGEDPRIHCGYPALSEGFSPRDRGAVSFAVPQTVGYLPKSPNIPGFSPWSTVAQAGSCPGSGPAGPVLVGITGQYTNARIPVTRDGIVIGRDQKQCNLVMSSKDVSRVHARVTFDHSGNKFIVEDLNSTNGIFIGRERIQRRTLLGSGESFTLSEDAATFMVQNTL